MRKKGVVSLLVILLLVVAGCGGRGSVARIHPEDVMTDRSALSKDYEDYFRVQGQDVDVRMINFLGDKSLLKNPLLGVPREYAYRVPVTIVPINPDQTGKKEMSRLGETPVNPLVTQALNNKLARLLLAAGYNVRSLEGGVGGVMFYQYLLRNQLISSVTENLNRDNPYAQVDTKKSIAAKIGFNATASSITYEQFNDLSVRIRGVGPKVQKFDLYVEFTLEIIDLETGMLYDSIVVSGVIRGTGLEFGATRWIQSGSVGDTLLDLHVGTNIEAQIDKSFEILMAYAINQVRKDLDGVLWRLMRKGTDVQIDTYIFQMKEEARKRKEELARKKREEELAKQREMEAEKKRKAEEARKKSEIPKMIKAPPPPPPPAIKKAPPDKTAPDKKKGSFSPSINKNPEVLWVWDSKKGSMKKVIPTKNPTKPRVTKVDSTRDSFDRVRDSEN